MSKKDDGGAAFPLSRESSFSKNYEGMSLRDYFAGKSMQGILANDISWTGHPGQAAQTAYQMADAMLAERAK